ncbi:hypothetical protein [Pseudomonas prosekii]|uniref:Uncharacterized protein n=1 Tax=Pseudomonas prosekii TaxID=1148509 RepID=A0A2U2DDH5_9PSED|nr:hypothetical protein [Pseudomonas prosekii]PWE47448.1 hypothetical protein C9I49_02835 [Pseudomonas prosekii]
MINNSSLRFLSRLLAFFCILAFFQVVFYINFDYYFVSNGSYLNIPDHIFYEGVVTGFGLAPDISSLNNYVVSFIYSIFYILGMSDLVLVSLVLNIIILSYAYSRTELLCFHVTQRFLPLLYWMGLLSVLQFSILINKDSFGVLFYVLLVSYLMLRRKTDLLLLLILCPVRLQFFLVLSFSIFLVGGINSRKGRLKVIAKVAFLYCLCSVIALYLESNESLLAHSYYSEGGVAYWISTLNSQYYIGSFLLNVLKPIQYVYDLFRSAIIDDSLLGWGVYFSRLYLVFVILILSVRFCSAVYLPWRFFERREKFFVSIVVCSFFLVYSISPIVDYRYLINIAPVLMLFFVMRKPQSIHGQVKVSEGQIQPSSRVDGAMAIAPETLRS